MKRNLRKFFIKINKKTKIFVQNAQILKILKKFLQILSWF